MLQRLPCRRFTLHFFTAFTLPAPAPAVDDSATAGHSGEAQSMDFMVGIVVVPVLLATYGLYWLVARLMEQPS